MSSKWKAFGLLAGSMATALGACSAERPAGIPPTSVVPTPVDAPRTDSQSPSGLRPQEVIQLASIDEKVPVRDQQVWLEKKYWLNRDIWVSLGVERASVTGLAGSVFGYVPARIERHGLQLVLMRRNDGLFGGSALGPELPVQAYPITGESNDELLVDLASPVTPFGLTLIGVEKAESAKELQPRLEYLKSLEVKEKSLTLNTVVVVQSPKPLFDKDEVSAENATQQDPHLLSMSLRTDWVLDAPTPEYQAVAKGESFGFFETLPLVRDSGTRTETFLNRVRQRVPFQWEMTPNTPEIYRDAVKAGVEMWNQALEGGVLQLQTRVGDGSRSITDPSVSNIVWDDNQAVSIAFANWRENPYTGEIIQAQVYMSGDMWAQQARMIYQLRRIEKSLRANASAPGAGGAAPPLPPPLARAELARIKNELARVATAPQARRFALGFTATLANEQAGRRAYCLRTVDLRSLKQQVSALETPPPEGAQTAPIGDASEAHLPYPSDSTTVTEFSQNVVRAVVLHEVGHTLGLRHNFIASKSTSDGGRIQSASIMDYNDLVVDASFDRPGDADKALLAAGYLGAAVPADFAFCTDENAEAGMPDCQPFDHASEPIDGLRVRQETNLLVALRLLQIGNAEAALEVLNAALETVADTMNYVVAPTESASEFLNDPLLADRQSKAWASIQASHKMLDLPYPAELQAQYSQLLTQFLVEKITAKSAGSAVFDRLVESLVETAFDAHGTQEIQTRLLSVDGLRKLQDLRARRALRDLQSRLLLPVAQRSLKEAEADDEVARAIAKILADGYFLRP